MIRKILTYPDPELKKKSLPVAVINEKTQELVRDMVEPCTMPQGRTGRSQIGVHQRIAVIDVSAGMKAGDHSSHQSGYRSQ
jgi:peptide deformylase